ncbi:aldo/keto reductase [Microbacterium excoecariae]|uniref:aldo/keto reductase n=1 Tax=Microbacterium excoecariae TaxID=2715210 RepID=UPI001407FF65|nr:aldo/keto reductase [Microbacterium excoecariae]NHI17542.1 aldo/keto reductase [Microbacterium excoecariae]
MILDETYTLANGVAIPRLGLGTWQISDASVAEAVRAAVRIGYRGIDSAQAYGNERGLGEGVRTSGVPREQLFVTTKLAAEIKDRAGAAAAIEGSLATLDIGYVDLMLIHGPQPWDDFRGGDYSDGNRQAWAALEDAYEAGRIRAIGVSNFLPADIENILSGARVAPQVNQVLAHPGNTPSELIEYCRARGIQVEAYSPIAHGEMLSNGEVTAMAGRYGVTVPQLCIRYTLQLGTVSLPKTANPAHMLSNSQVDFVISDDDMSTLRALRADRYSEDNDLFSHHSA